MASGLVYRYFSILHCRFKYSLPTSIKHVYSPCVLIHRFHPLCGIKGTQIKMPSLSPTMTEGTIVKWLKKEGDSFSPGEVLCEIQTDKAVVGFEMEEEGILAKILVPEDTKDVKLGTVIALMVDEGEDWKNVEIPSTVVQAPLAEQPVSMEKRVKDVSATDTLLSEFTGSTSAHHLIGPAVKLLLEKYKLDATKISPSGPHKTVLKGDVLKYIEKYRLSTPQTLDTTEKEVVSSIVLQPFGADSYIDIPNTSMRKIIAKRLTESKSTIPHAYIKVACQINELIEIRKKFKNEGISVSVNDFVIKGVAGALQQVPEMNVICNNNTVQRVLDIDIAVAVATEAGLITPIIRGADRLGVQNISEMVKELAARARDGKLQPHEYQGGSFCISNLGMFGVTEFSAVINPPQGGILAVGTIQTIIGIEGKPESKIIATLSYDARVIDEDIAGRFLQTFRQYMEEPHMMLALAPIRNELSGTF